MRGFVKGLVLGLALVVGLAFAQGFRSEQGVGMTLYDESGNSFSFPAQSGTVMLTNQSPTTGAAVDYILLPQWGADLTTNVTTGCAGIDVVKFQRFTNPYSVSVTGVNFHNTTSGAGTDCGFAIYTSDGATNLTECSFETATTGTQTCDLADITLDPGEYLLGWSCNNNQGCRAQNIGGFNSIFSQGSPELWGTCSTTAGADSDMPATCGTLTHVEAQDLIFVAIK